MQLVDRRPLRLRFYRTLLWTAEWPHIKANSGDATGVSTVLTPVQVMPSPNVERWLSGRP